MENGGTYLTTTNTEFTDREERNHWYLLPSRAAANTGTADLSVDGCCKTVTRATKLMFNYCFESSINDWDFEVSYSDIERKVQFGCLFLPECEKRRPRDI